MAFQSAPVENTEVMSTNVHENYKRAVSTMLILQVLSQRDCYTQEVADYIQQTSNGVISFTALHTNFLRLEQVGAIKENGRRTANGRVRRYYTITESGRMLLKEQLNAYTTFSDATNQILKDRATYSPE